MAETTITCPSGLAGRIRGTKVREPRPIRNYSPALSLLESLRKERFRGHIVKNQKKKKNLYKKRPSWYKVSTQKPLQTGGPQDE